MEIKLMLAPFIIVSLIIIIFIASIMGIMISFLGGILLIATIAFFGIASSLIFLTDLKLTFYRNTHADGCLVTFQTESICRQS